MNFTRGFCAGRVFPSTTSIVAALLLGCLLTSGQHGWAQYEPTLQDIRDTILGTRSGTQDELNAMDINTDGRIDVADMISLLNPEYMFKDSSAQVDEGEEITVVFYLPTLYTGTVHYTVSGTATAGQDYESLSGSVAVNGSSVPILVKTTDDLDLENLETIIISLEVADSDLLALGPVQQYIVHINDNDAVWSGSLSAQNMNVGFDVTLLKEGSGYTAILNSNGLGVIPAGEWNASVEVTPSTFRCVLGPIAAAVEATPFNVPLERTIILEADPSAYPDDILDNETIAGRMTETVLVGENRTYMNLTNEKALSGTFVLIKDVSN